MATETDRTGDFVLLNAFVDGELSPAERAAIAARLAADPDVAHAHVTLARLKACVADSADDTAAIDLPPRRRRIPRAAFVAAAAAIGCIAILAGADFARRGPARGPVLAPPTTVTFANLPSRPLLPHLELAGLSLAAVSVENAGAAATVVATYRGPHGCRLDLRAGPAGRDLGAAQGSSRHGWEVGEMRYELVAHGMPQWRFAIIAQAAEKQTRGDHLPQGLERRLREARASAPPCAG